jgi:hypothetical protein
MDCSAITKCADSRDPLNRIVVLAFPQKVDPTANEKSATVEKTQLLSPQYNAVV